VLKVIDEKKAAAKAKVVDETTKLIVAGIFVR
jgi:hypothetical protein